MTVEIDKISGVLGITVPDEDIVRIMNNLDMKPSISEKDGKRMLTLRVPAYRDDMEGYQDVAEEVIRMYGYDKLVPTFLKSAEVTTGGWNPVQRREMRVKEALCGLGAYECMPDADHADGFHAPCSRAQPEERPPRRQTL